MIDVSFTDNLRRLLRHLSPVRRGQLAVLVVFMLVAAGAELVALGAVVPFVTVLANPAQAAQNPIVSAFMAVFHLDTARLPVGISLAFAIVVVAAAAIRLTLLWASYRFAYGWGYDLSCALYGKTLHRPYSFHISKNTSTIIGAIGKVQFVISSYIIPVLTGVIAAFLATTIIATLVLVDPVVALGGAAVFGFSYFVIALMVRKRLRTIGAIHARMNDLRIQTIQEGLGGIRDVILDRAQSAYQHRFASVDGEFRHAQARSEFLGGCPRILIEALGMLLIAGFAFAYSASNAGLSNLLPVLGSLAIGAQRLMPLLQQMYRGWTAVVAGHVTLQDVLELLEYEPLEPPQHPIEFHRDIQFQDVSFYYGTQPGTPSVIRTIDFQLRRGETVGIVGATGSGKSTLVDLLMGLLSPSTGRFLVDDHEITPANAPSWQRHIAHVPQSIFLSDTSIAENIAFGQKAGAIDAARLERATKAAQIHDHISSLPQGFQTPVGERGIRLSGGQRQRLGIARALYRQADVLVLDEATSALDDETEDRVMAGIRSMATGVTVVMIAHRLTTLRTCDRILELDRGRLVGIFTFDELMARRSQIKDATVHA